METLNKTVNILNIMIDNLSWEEALAAVTGCVQKRENIFIVTPNTDHMVKLQKDVRFYAIYKQAKYRFADGMPLMWAARLLGTPLKAKLSGSDMLPRLCQRAAKLGFRVFFLGGRTDAAKRCAQKYQQAYPGLRVVGTDSPAMGFEKDAEACHRIVEKIRRLRPDLLFVGLGAPKQEKWIFDHYRELKVPVSIGVGVSFEFGSGMIRRAPLWMQRSGLEWLWRLGKEPRRLWKRYLVEDLQFVWLIARQLVRRRRTAV